MRRFEYGYFDIIKTSFLVYKKSCLVSIILTKILMGLHFNQTIIINKLCPGIEGGAKKIQFLNLNKKRIACD